MNGKFFWFGIRLALVLVVVFSPDKSSFALVPEGSYLVAILGGALISGGLAIWLFLVPDQSFKKPILDILLFSPLLPAEKCASALWSFFWISCFYWEHFIGDY